MKLEVHQGLPPAPDVPLSRSKCVELVSVQHDDAVNSVDRTGGAAVKIQPSTSDQVIPCMATVDVAQRLVAGARYEHSDVTQGLPMNM